MLGSEARVCTGWVAALRLFFSLAGMMRPLLLYLAPLFLPLLPFRSRGSLPGRGRLLVAYFVPVLLVIVGWSGFNQVTVHCFGPSTLTGYTLMTHAGEFIEYAPDE
jgi:hypothetical protein